MVISLSSRVTLFLSDWSILSARLYCWPIAVATPVKFAVCAEIFKKVLAAPFIISKFLLVSTIKTPSTRLEIIEVSLPFSVSSTYCSFDSALVAWATI